MRPEAGWSEGSSRLAGAIGVSERPTKRGSRKSSQGRARLEYLKRVSESEIARTSPPELSDLPDDIWDDAEVVLPEGKEPISIRVDKDVLSWFRESGPRYQTKMNAVLREYVRRMRDRDSR